MKLHVDPAGGRNLFTGYGAGHVAINHHQHTSNLIVLPERIIEPWTAHPFASLQASDFEPLCALDAEVVLLGTGQRQRFPAPALLRPLIEARIGYEVMDLAAACRTFNILMTEGRRVAAALLIEP